MISKGFWISFQMQRKCQQKPCWPCCQILENQAYFFCPFSILILPRWRPAKVEYTSRLFLSFTLSSELHPCPVPQTLAYSIHTFGWPDSCVGIKLLLCLAVSTSSDKCPWLLWNSINPVQSFPRGECTVYHVCYSWHAEQQGLLTSN